MRLAHSMYFFFDRIKSLLAVLTGAFLISWSFNPALSFAQQANFGINLSNGKEKVVLNADHLEMRDKENIAVFSGNVSVIQGDRILRTSKLIVHYAKSNANNEGAASGGLGSTGVEKMEATGKVYIKTGNQVATGDEGVFNSKTNTMVLTGSRVILTDGNNVATGCKLTAHMDTGKAFLQSCTGKNGQGRVSIIMDRNTQNGH